MCGIVGVVRRPSTRAVPSAPEQVAVLDRAVAQLRDVHLDAARAQGVVDVLNEVAGAVESVGDALGGPPGVACLLADRAGALAIGHRAEALRTELVRLDADADADRQPATGSGPAERDSAHLETVNAALVGLADAIWRVGRDRLVAARAVADLAAGDVGRAAIEVLTSVQIALAALDRLEVRGRDSAGLHLLVTDHGLDLADPDIAALLVERGADPRFGSGSVRTPGGHLGFVYKAAAEIGELGDNTAALRTAIRDDPLLHLALGADTVTATVLATRAGRASARSRRRTPIPSATRSRTTAAPPPWPRSTATSTTTPTSSSAKGSTSPTASPPTRR